MAITFFPPSSNYGASSSGGLTVEQLQLLNDLVASVAGANGTWRVRGGDVASTGGMTATVSACEYYLAFARIESDAQSVGFATADETHGRIDVVYLDSNGVAGVLTGTASANPVKPQVDPATQIELTSVQVDAGATDLSGDIDVVDIYQENTEWTATTTDAGTITLASTDDHYAGSKAIKLAAAVNGDNVVLDKESLQDMTQASYLVVWIKALASWGSSASNFLRFSWLNSTGAQIGTTLSVANGQRGLSTTNLSDWQPVLFPISTFGLGINSPQKLRIEARGTGGVHCYVDAITLQLGAAAAPNMNFLTALVDDLAPRLGGNLDANNKRIGNVLSVGYVAGAVSDSGTAKTIAWNTASFWPVTMTGNCTFTFTAPGTAGNVPLRLKLIQDATGSRTATWPASVKWAGGAAPTLTTTAGGVDWITFIYDGTNYWGVASANFG